MAKARLKELYDTTLIFQLKEDLGLKNIMEVPSISKIVLNVGVKDANTDSKALKTAQEVLDSISGQRSVKTRARKSIAGFKLREGQAIGCKVTLRRNEMYTFLDKLVNFALPKVRDFQGVTTQFDKRGNYNLGVKEWTIFPEVDRDLAERVQGLNITIETTTDNDDYAFKLLKTFGMPFRKQK